MKTKYVTLPTIDRAPFFWFNRDNWLFPDGTIVHAEYDNTLYLIQPNDVWYIGKLPPDYNSTQLELI
jgi:hypothetical protein